MLQVRTWDIDIVQTFAVFATVRGAGEINSTKAIGLSDAVPKKFVEFVESHVSRTKFRVNAPDIILVLTK
jgi:hypothetical protein